MRFNLITTLVAVATLTSRSSCYALSSTKPSSPPKTPTEASSTLTNYDDMDTAIEEASSFLSTSDQTEESSKANIYKMMEFTACALGNSHLSLLSMSIKGADEALKAVNSVKRLPEERQRFQSMLECIKGTVEECSLECLEYGEAAPPQVLHLNSLVQEGSCYLQGLDNADDFISTLASQLLQGNPDPASKLSQLTLQMREAESRLQLHRAVALAKRQQESEIGMLKHQVESLQESIEALVQARLSPETRDAQKAHSVLRGGEHGSVRMKRFGVLSRLLRLRRRKRDAPDDGDRRSLSTAQLETLKNPSISKELVDGIQTTPQLVQDLETQSLPLRAPTPLPPNEAQRLQVLRDMRLVQLEMDGTAVGFEYLRSLLVASAAKMLSRSLPHVYKEETSVALQIVGTDDSYSLVGDWKVPSPVTPRSQVPCQHVVCWNENASPELNNVDGFTSHDVLAINLRGAHKDLARNFCYPPETQSYIGAPIRVSGVTIGSLCVANDETIEELQWTEENSRQVRTIASVLEEQLARLCADWNQYEGIPTLDSKDELECIL